MTSYAELLDLPGIGRRADAEIAALQLEVGNLTTERDNLEIQAGQAQDALETANTQLAAATTQVAALNRQLLTAQDQVAADTRVIETLQAKARTDEALIASLRAEIARLTPPPPPPPVPVDPQPTGADIVRFQDLPPQGRISQTLALPAAKGKFVSLPPGLLEAVGFQEVGTPPNYGIFDMSTAGILGSGVDKTIIQIKPNSSAKVGWYENIKRNTAYPKGFIACTAQNGWCMEVVQAGTTGATAPAAWAVSAVSELVVGGNPLVTGTTYTDGTVVWKVLQNTNPVHAMQFQGSQFKRAEGFWLKGTPQGHLHGGLRFANITDGLVRKVKVSGFAGSNPGNPGEIFMLPTNRCTGMTFEDVELDGRDEAGNRIGVSLLGLNNGSDITVKGGYFHHTRTDMGAGVAAWQMRNLTYIGTRIEDTGSRGFSHERCSGTITLDHVTALRCKGSHAKFDNDQESAVVNIIDPVFDGPKFLVKINAEYPAKGVANKQRREDIHLFVNGVERPDLLQIF